MTLIFLFAFQEVKVTGPSSMTFSKAETLEKVVGPSVPAKTTQCWDYVLRVPDDIFITLRGQCVCVTHSLSVSQPQQQPYINNMSFWTQNFYNTSFVIVGNIGDAYVLWERQRNPGHYHWDNSHWWFCLLTTTGSAKEQFFHESKHKPFTSLPPPWYNCV